jgi:hypothetical protein
LVFRAARFPDIREIKMEFTDSAPEKCADAARDLLMNVGALQDDGLLHPAFSIPFIEEVVQNQGSWRASGSPDTPRSARTIGTARAAKSRSVGKLIRLAATSGKSHFGSKRASSSFTGRVF